MSTPKPPKENVERTGPQDLSAVSGLGFAGAGIGVFPYGGNAGGMLGGSGFGGGSLWPNGMTVPIGALVGPGTLEGTNKYTPPILSAAGITGYGLLPGARKWAGTLGTYRIMSTHPTIVIAAITIYGAVLAAEWEVEIDDGVPKEAKEAVEKFLFPLRYRFARECLRALTLGCTSFEKVWESRDGYITYKHLKPLLPERSQPVVDKHGNYAGIVESAGGIITTGIDVDPAKVIEPTYATTYAFNRIGDDYTGQPLMENVRRAWSNWLNCDDNLARLGAKVSSIIPVVKYPSGLEIDINGTKVSAFNVATGVAQGLASGRPVVAPNLAGTEIEDMMRAGNLAKASLWDIDTVDMGEAGGTINALLAQLQYYDKQMVRGWCQSERSVLEAVSSGSRADGEAHKDTGISFCEDVWISITEAANCGLVDDFVRFNFSEKLVGKVRLKASPIVDEVKAVSRDLVKAMSTGKTLNELLKRVDVDQLLSNVKVPREEGTEGPWEPEPEPTPMMPGMGQPAQPNGKPAKPGVNGNGRLAAVGASGKDEN